ncbi:uncharacterized protein LOC113752331 [Coffea eugenioides]|uniref:uncharacterized protein LOC113752331 n=1 Tax=Coffea eugenioides TaxID=49369 RepID=UPI000F60CD9C|nr:uncharacterized protein LOC113752331 [Coffea eugenioides]
MEGELSDILQKFSLEGNELVGLMLEGEDFQTGVRACENSIIGRVLGEKVINFTGIKNFVAVAWGYPRNLSVVELGPNVFQFNLQNSEDKDRIVEGGPWVIDNQMLVLKRWVEGIEDDYKAFVTAPLWVQLWNLPVHWLSKEIGRKIGAVFKEVRDVVIPQVGGKEGRHLKALVMADLSKPLLRGTVVRIAGTGKWIAFKYERCPDFYYNCGIVGHSERSCKDRRLLGGNTDENQYGPWMRAGNVRVSPQKKNDRVWNGELVEQEKIKRHSNQSLLEVLKATGSGGGSNQEGESESLKVVSHNRVEGQVIGDKEDLELPQFNQEGEDLQLSHIEEEMEEDIVEVVHNQIQESRVLEKESELVVFHQETQGENKMVGLLDRQTRRTFRKLKTPARTRRPLQVIQVNANPQVNVGKRKILLRDEVMEDAYQDMCQWKKTKQLEELYFEGDKENEERSFLNGTSRCK